MGPTHRHTAVRHDFAVSSSAGSLACCPAADRRAIRTFLAAAIACGSLLANTAQSADSRSSEPGWLPVVVARGETRVQIEATPIEERPYRPLHFYGNTVRRVFYRGTPVPRMGEVLALPVRVVGREPAISLSERFSESWIGSRRR